MDFLGKDRSSTALSPWTEACSTSSQVQTQTKTGVHLGLVSTSSRPNIPTVKKGGRVIQVATAVFHSRPGNKSKMNNTNPDD
jgi:hypothetical protein